MTEILVAKDVSLHFPQRRASLLGPRRYVRAVDGISLAVERGRTLAVVGESGSGKSTFGRVAINLLKPTGGTIAFEGKDLSGLPSRDLRRVQQDMTMIFQDTYSSLDPTWCIADIVSEPLRVHGVADRAQRVERALEALIHVGLGESALWRYPREFSGGQRQRIGIARALITRPKVIVCDEPVSALDVSTRAQVLSLMKNLQDELGLSYLFISHDIGVVEAISHRTAVVYLGRLVELGETAGVIGAACHPYTAALLSAVPRPNPRYEKHRQRILLKGDPPSPVSPPSGCHFHPRCPLAMDICARERPALTQFAGGNSVACHLHTSGPRLAGAPVKDLLAAAA